jgi:hypothetical protein
MKALNPRFRLLAVLAALLLGGCVSSATSIQYTPAGPAEQTCTLKVISTLTVLEMDGEEVNWQADSFDYWAQVRIPQGKHAFVLDYRREANNSRSFGYHYRNAIVISYDRFTAGHTYELVAAEGAEAGGFSGLFTNMLQAMSDTVNRALRIGIRDLTADPDGEFTWLTPESYAK